MSVPGRRAAENKAHTGLWSLVQTDCTELYAKHFKPELTGTLLMRRRPMTRRHFRTIKMTRRNFRTVRRPVSSKYLVVTLIFIPLFYFLVFFFSLSPCEYFKIRTNCS